MAYLRLLERVNRVLARIGMGALLVMMTVVTLNVLGRAIFNTPIYGTLEITELTGVIMVSLIIAFTQILREHIIVSIAVDRMPPRLRAGLDTFTLILSLAFAVMVIWTTGAFGLKFPSDITYIFEIITLPFRLVFVFGFIVVSLVLIGQIIESLAKVVK
jgi:TRAP-type C4-dicarboxylate transport system permease small subunit